ncbi:MAG: NADH-quinone oxidoreductase subunit NuoE [Armatimonadota bacterium]
MSSTNSDRADAAVLSIIEKYDRDQRNMIPLLHEIQAELGYLSPEIMETVAEQLGTTVGHVHGVATFYTLFSTRPQGRYVIRLCDSPPCHLEGSAAIRKAIENELGISEGETTEDGYFSLETVSCLGLCGVSPAMMVNEDIYGNLTPESIPEIIKRYREGD